MQRNGTGLYQAGEFAALAGVTVRTLHHYDDLGLLRLKAHSEAGYRLYGRDELAQLQQITALRFIGFTLKDIKELIGDKGLPLGPALRMQREIIARKRKQLDAAIIAIERAEAAVGGDTSEQWNALRNVMETMNMQQDWDWVKQQYTPEQLARLAERDDPAMHQQWQNQWTDLIAQVESAKDEDPASERAQELAKQWDALIFRFTNGETDIEQSMKNVYSQKQTWPKDFKRPWSDGAAEFIHKAIAILKNKSPQ